MATAQAQIDTRLYVQPGDSAAGDNNLSRETAGQNQTFAPALDGVRNIFSRLPVYGFSYSGQFTQLADSQPGGAAPGSGWDEISRLNMQFAYRKEKRFESTVLQYNVGGDAYAHDTGLDNIHHEAALNQIFSVGRFSFDLGDHFTYFPQSSFGFNETQIIPDANSGLTSSAGQNILYQRSVQLGNNASAEADYVLGARSSLSLSGSYDQLWFENRELQNNNQIVANAAYNRVVTGKLSASFSYAYQEIFFPGIGDHIRMHGPSLAFQYSLNSKVKVKVSAGPQFRTYENIVPNPGMDINAATNADLICEVGKSSFDLGYSRQTTAGSGVMLGAESDIAMLGIARPFGRLWNATLSGGYARNSSLQATSLLPQVANSTFAAVHLFRQMGSRSSFFVGYSLRSQTAELMCTGTVCQAYPRSHEVSIGLSFQSRQPEVAGGQ